MNGWALGGNEGEVLSACEIDHFTYKICPFPSDPCKESLMNTSYTPAQFTKGLREARDEERQAVIAHATKHLNAAVKARSREGASALMGLIIDLREGDHAR